MSQAAHAAPADAVPATMAQAEGLLQAGDFDTARVLYAGLLQGGHDGYALRVNLAQCLKRLGRWAEAIAQFEAGFKLRRGSRNGSPGAVRVGPLRTYQVEHLLEQLEFLRDSGEAGWFTEEDRAGLVRLRKFMSDCYGAAGQGNPPDLSPRIADLVVGCPSRVEGEVPASIINPQARVETIEAGPDGDLIHIVDDIFDPVALAALRAFLTRSTFWFDARPERRYLGAHLHDGLAGPLIRDVSAAVLGFAGRFIGEALISQVWAFKYAPVAAGIDLHADQADMNINLWLTDERFNTDRATGGMTIHGARVPEHWSFGMYNASPDSGRAHLKAVGAAEHRIPYRGNRAIIFPSRLFHQTDPVRFHRDYDKRRINMTIMADRKAPRR